MTWLEDQAFTEMYERGGFMISADASLTLLAGSTLGGGMSIGMSEASVVSLEKRFEASLI